jgi:TonB family protein
MLVRTVAAGALLGIGACGNGDQRTGMQMQAARDRPDEPPVMLNTDLPFRYPPPLYARKVQGNVTLRLFIDTNGGVRAESTRVEESSGYGPLDTAAINGSRELQFIPAKLNGLPMGVVVLFPVYFRHPEAAPLPGDTVVRMREAGSGKRPDSAARAPRPPSRP